MMRMCIVLGMLALVGCATESIDPPPAAADVAAPDAGPVVVEPTVTWKSDVKPVLDAYCSAGCHVAGGIAPFELVTYEQAAPLATLIQSVVEAGTMPPWGAEAGHNSYRFDFSLPEATVALISDWVEQGAAAGAEDTEGVAIDLPRAELGSVDLEIGMMESYAPTKAPDDYRCFVIEWPLDKPAYVTGFEGLPGNASIVHHMVTFLIPPYQAGDVDDFEALDPAPGYPCFGGPTPTVPGYDAPGLQARILGQWAPGFGAVLLPEGTGVPVEPGTRAIFQVHYNNSAVKPPEPDLSRVAFTLADDVEHPGVVLPWLNLLWPLSPNTMLIPAGESGVLHEFEAGVEQAGTAQLYGLDDLSEGVYVHSFFPHMHQLGREISLRVIRENGDDEVLVRIPAYDFSWQREYALAEAAFVGPKDRIRLECIYDNTVERRQKYGLEPTPIDTMWGEGTSDEMCVSTLYITAP